MRPRKFPQKKDSWAFSIQISLAESDWGSVVFSTDGKQIASISGDRTIKLWEATTGNLRKTFEGDSDWFTAIAFSPGSKKIVSESGNKTIKLWDIAKVLRFSRMFGNRVGRRIDFCKWQEIKTS